LGRWGSVFGHAKGYSSAAFLIGFGPIHRVATLQGPGVHYGHMWVIWTSGLRVGAIMPPGARGRQHIAQVSFVLVSACEATRLEAFGCKQAGTVPIFM
jgi:hypothetical protein